MADPAGDVIATDALATFERTRLAMQRARVRLEEAEREVTAGVAAGLSVTLDKAWSAAVEWTVWVIAVDDVVAKALTWEGRDQIVDEKAPGVLTRIGGHLAGLRYLRNLHVHQLTDTLHVIPRDAVAHPVPRLAWKSLDDLPDPERSGKHVDAQRAAYRANLSGQWVGPIAQRIGVGYASSTWREHLSA